MLFTEVDPETFIDHKVNPPHGRGFWNKTGKANGSWRYEYIPRQPKIGTNAQVSLDAWATCAGSYGYQLILVQLGVLRALAEKEKGIYGPSTTDAVRKFQSVNIDPETSQRLYVDGTIGQSDSRALITPIIDAAEKKYSIPNSYLRGETNQESRLDLGALGYYIYYGSQGLYKGVDRSISQINSEANPQVSWEQSFDPYFAIGWSGARMRSYYDRFKQAFPKQSETVLWDAALCAHNNPYAAGEWARKGAPVTQQASAYVNAAKAARY